MRSLSLKELSIALHPYVERHREGAVVQWGRGIVLEGVGAIPYGVFTGI